jgi:hypothetical protein
MKRHRIVLLAAAAASAAWLAIDPGPEATVEAVSSTRPASARPNPAPLELPARRALGEASVELFASPPRPPRPARAATAPPPPAAPPLPYRFAGKARRGAEEEVLISKGDLVFPIKPGDTLDGMYRVESIAADRIELVYLPLGTEERIAIASTLDPP